MLLHGYKEHKGETTPELRKNFMDFLRNMRISIPDTEIAQCHRDGPRYGPKYSRPVFLSFYSEVWQIEVLRHSKKFAANNITIEWDYKVTPHVEVGTQSSVSLAESTERWF